MKWIFQFFFLLYFLPVVQAQESDVSDLNLDFEKANNLLENRDYTQAKKIYWGLLEKYKEKEEWNKWYKVLSGINDCEYYLGNPYTELITLYDEGEVYSVNLSVKNQVSYLRSHAYLLKQIGRIQLGLNKVDKAVSILKKTNEIEPDEKNRILKSALRNLSVYHSFFNDHALSIKYCNELLIMIDDNDIVARDDALRLLFQYHLHDNNVMESSKILTAIKNLNIHEPAYISILESRLNIAKGNLISPVYGLNKALALSRDSLKKNNRILNIAQKAKDKDQIEIYSKRVNSIRAQIQSIFSLQAVLFENKEELNKSKNFYIESLNYLEQQYDVRAYAKELQKYAKLQVKLDDLKGALESSQKVLNLLCKSFEDTDVFVNPKENQIIPEAWIMEALYQKASIFRLLLQRGELINERVPLINESFDKAIYCMDLLRQNYQDDDSKYGMTSVMSDLFNDAFKFNIDRLDSSDSDQVKEKLFEYAQIKKAFVFKSSMSLREGFRQSGVPDKLIEEYLQIKSIEIEKGEVISSKIDSLKNIENKISEIYPASKRLFVSGFIGIDAVQDNLLENQTLLNFVQLDSTDLYVILISKDQVEVVSSSLPKGFQQSVEDYHRSLSDLEFVSTDYKKAESMFLRSSKFLFEHTFEKILKILAPSINLVTVVPDGDIHKINFENLVFENSDDWRRVDKMLVSKFSFNYLYDTNQLKSQSNSPQTVIGQYLLAYDYGNSEKQVASTSGESNRQNFHYLPSVAEEVEMISELLGVSAYLNPSKSKEEIKKELKENELVHFAGHAFSDESIDKAYLVFQAPDSDQYEYLKYNEIIALNLKSHLITLSACQTNSGENIRNEGVLSLARAFTESGVKSTLGSSWNAPDVITKKILTLFYENLLAGKNKTEAIHQAKLKFLTSDDLSSPSDRLPAYWSNWKLYGDITPLQFHTKANYLIWAMVLFAFFLFLLFFLKRLN